MALTSLQKENSRDALGAWKDRASNGLLEIHATAALLRSATGRIHKLQAPRFGHQGSQNSLASGDANVKWRAKINTRVSINLNHKHALKIVL